MFSVAPSFVQIHLPLFGTVMDVKGARESCFWHILREGCGGGGGGDGTGFRRAAAGSRSCVEGVPISRSSASVSSAPSSVATNTTRLIVTIYILIVIFRIALCV